MGNYERMKMIDLFSGIGGFSLAASLANIDTVQFVECDKFCQKVLAKHFPGVPIHDDIKTFTYNGHVDLITGGFPCQPFSTAGKKKGKEDERHLWPEFKRIIREVKPAWVIAENVPGIVKMELDNILTDLETENYATEAFILPACSANAPHRRDRIWIIAHSNGERCNERRHHWERGSIQENIERYLQEVHAQWEELKPKSWKSMQASGWMRVNAVASRNNDGVSDRVDRLRSLGNAIVPQVIYPIMKFIYEFERLK